MFRFLSELMLWGETRKRLGNMHMEASRFNAGIRWMSDGPEIVAV